MLCSAAHSHCLPIVCSARLFNDVFTASQSCWRVLLFIEWGTQKANSLQSWLCAAWPLTTFPMERFPHSINVAAHAAQDITGLCCLLLTLVWPDGWSCGIHVNFLEFSQSAKNLQTVKVFLNKKKKNSRESNVSLFNLCVIQCQEVYCVLFKSHYISFRYNSSSSWESKAVMCT